MEERFNSNEEYVFDERKYRAHAERIGVHQWYVAAKIANTPDGTPVEVVTETMAMHKGKGVLPIWCRKVDKHD